MTFQYKINKLVLSHSTLSLFHSCARKFEFSKLYGDAQNKEEMFAAEVGKCLHAGFQEYLINHDENRAIVAMLLSYPHEMEFSDIKNHYTRSLEACYVVLMNLINSPIVDKYDLVRIKNEKGEEVPAIEVPFCIEITGSPFPLPVFFVGFIDAILYDRVDNIYIVNDIKSTRIKIDDYSVRYQFDEQTVPYGIILEHLLGRKIDEFKVSYLSAYIDLEDAKINLYQFPKTREDIHDWFRGLCEDIGTITRYFNAKWFRRVVNGGSCFAFNKPCWFATYCSNRDPEITEKLIGGVMREGLFHDDQKPLVNAKLEYREDF